jgi:hypothetical protein
MNTNSDSPQNDAVERCNRAWQRAYNKEVADIDEDEDTYPAKKAGNAAYRRAMPPLSGYQNICDFIACVTNALVLDAIAACDAKRLLAAAKIAITAVRSEPAPPKNKRPELSKDGQELLKAAPELSNDSPQIPGEPDANESGARTKGGQIENEKGLGIQLEEALE